MFPYFPAEPFPTHYLRTGRGYRFVQTWLRAALGDANLDANSRVNEGGSRADTSLAEELQRHVELSYGLYALSCAHLGMDPEAYLFEDELDDVDLDAATETAQTWLQGCRTDEDVLTDPRVVVPVAYDVTQDDQVYWATVGVKVWKVDAEFVEGYEPEVVAPPLHIRRVCRPPVFHHVQGHPRAVPYGGAAHSRRATRGVGSVRQRR